MSMRAMRSSGGNCNVRVRMMCVVGATSSTARCVSHACNARTHHPLETRMDARIAQGTHFSLGAQPAPGEHCASA
ncbi:hypothetical protein AB870_26075 [Pandoraea faecigallinarum]|uniref:Uncharacterized protein n=1 Tax=Pandoraea faecigallinarum TaxID=656179 RepID=A0A173H018_9BURK|nr:hypothetical protein AB870_26075 [Pandoraea faecigallinarum]